MEKSFEIVSINALKNEHLNWPVVYCLFNRKSKQIYIGETVKIKTRLNQHDTGEDKENKSKLNERYLISHKKANKSLSFFLESYLINLSFADEDLELTNSKMQQNYNNRNFYTFEDAYKDAPKVWDELYKLQITTKTSNELENTDLFKYSPFKDFSEDQSEIIKKIKENFKKNVNSKVSGSAGTGKTLIIIKIAIDLFNEFPGETLKNKIGIYSAKTGNDKSIKRVLKRAGYLNKIKVIKDLSDNNLQNLSFLLIDEAQRLKQYRSDYSVIEYLKSSQKTDVEQLLKFSNLNLSLFYDRYQLVSKNDINLIDSFQKINFKNENNEAQFFELKSQFRTSAGDEYIRFVKDFLQLEKTDSESSRYFFKKYDLKSFNNLINLVNYTKEKSLNFERVRLSGALQLTKEKHPWNSENEFKMANDLKFKKISELQEGKYDFLINGEKFIWNKKAIMNDWLQKSEFNEIGSVHSLQGKDLTYNGLIFGEEIDFENGEIIIDLKKCKGIRFQFLKSDEQKIQLIKNEYYVLMTRGIDGLGVYIPNLKLREHFEKMISMINYEKEFN